MKKILMILLLTVFSFSFAENRAPQYRYTVVLMTLRYDGNKVEFKIDTRMNELPPMVLANAFSDLADQMKKIVSGQKEI